MSKKKISDFRPQRRNANRHTPRGLGMLDESISDGGWIGAITTAANGETFDGSARLETVYNRFGEDVEPIVVESDGTRPIIFKRMDIATADDPRAKKLAIAANRIASVDLDWDGEVLSELAEEIDLSGMFFQGELDDLVESGNMVVPEISDIESARKSLTKKAGFVKIVLANVEISVFERAIAVKLPLEIDELVRSRSDISQFVAIAIIEKLEREGCLPPKSNPLAKNQIGITVNI